jgi:hypothetical protein
MKKMPGPAIWLLLILLLALSFAVPAEAGPSYGGTWQRAAKYVNGALKNSIPAALVLTETSDNPVVLARSNTLTIDSFHGNSFTMTMVSCNCPAGGPVRGPGTVINRTRSLREIMAMYFFAGDVGSFLFL